MQYALFDQQITTTRHMWHADLGHTVTDTLHIFRAARVKAELCKQTGSIIVRCPSLKKGRNVHFCKKAPTLVQITFDRYLSNPDIGRTFCGGLTPSN